MNSTTHTIISVIHVYIINFTNCAWACDWQSRRARQTRESVREGVASVAKTKMSSSCSSSSEEEQADLERRLRGK